MTFIGGETFRVVPPRHMSHVMRNMVDSEPPDNKLGGRMGSGGEQQFCLRWHNYQSSLLATLPLLLDGDDLTDVTLCAGGKSLKAHRVVLSACSQYFKDLFKEMQPMQHPVIVVPGAEFNDLCALVTFMYSGEVNIYQHQLTSLLTMADTLQIRGLAEFTANPSFMNSSVSSQDTLLRGDRKAVAAAAAESSGGSGSPRCGSKRAKMMTSAQAEDLLLFPAATTKPPSALTPNKPKTHKPTVKPDPEVIASYWDTFGQHMAEDLSQRVNSSHSHSLDENILLSAAGELLMDREHRPASAATVKQEQVDQEVANSGPSTTPPDNNNYMPTDLTQGNSMETKLRGAQNSAAVVAATGGGSKLYATCCVCGKQLSNQYNLRVHMETHQNAHYACSVCSHVSRSRDALRKHVSYRHPQSSGGGGGDTTGGGGAGGNRSKHQPLQP